jgi:hypothetical protein
MDRLDRLQGPKKALRGHIGACSLFPPLFPPSNRSNRSINEFYT